MPTAQKRTVSQTQKKIKHLDNGKLGSSNVKSVNIGGKTSESLLQSIGPGICSLDTRFLGKKKILSLCILERT
jgi:hypothetical protein